MLRLHRCLARDTTTRILIKATVTASSSRIRYKTTLQTQVLVRCFHEKVTLNEPRTSLQGYLSSKQSKLNSKILLHDYSSVEQLVNSEALRGKYLIALNDSSFYTDKEIDIIDSIFHNAIDLAFGFKDPTTINLLLEIWKIAFHKQGDDPSLDQLQHRLIKYKNDLINVLINSKNYQFYDQYIRPLYHNPKLTELQKSWEDTLISTYELSDDGRMVNINRNKIKAYLGDKSIGIQNRRRLLANLIKSGIINAQNHDEKYIFISYFFEFLPALGDDHLRFIDPEYNCYTKVLRLIAMPFQGFGFLKHVRNLTSIFEVQELEKESQSDLITSLMRSISFSSNNVLNYWKFKLDTYFNEDNKDSLTAKDLKYAMMALLDLNEYQKVVDLYEEFPELHDDDHIEVLLMLNERMKDWKSMQKRFEDMYGRGNLPFVVHYAIVMNALASTGATSEVEQLLHQLKDRQLTPDRHIFKALIKCKVFDNDLDGALTYFNSYCDLVRSGKLESDGKSSLFLLVFGSYINSSDLDGALGFLDKCLQDSNQQVLGVIDSLILSKLIDLAAAQFRLNEVMKLQKLADKLDVTSDDLSLSLARAYAKFGQFEIADKLIYDAHKNSAIPFTNAKVFAGQLRNYRFWLAHLTHSEKRMLCKVRMKFIVNLVSREKNKLISPKSNESLFQEVITYYIQDSDMAGAYDTLEKVKRRLFLSEEHYLPFLKHYSGLQNFKAHSAVLKIYKEMVSQRIALTARTYVYLLRTMLFLDKQNQKGYGHSLRLLSSVFEMNGLSLKGVHPISKSEHLKLKKNAIFLCQLVSDYVNATRDPRNADMLFQFFNQMRDVLGSGMSIEFKMTVCNEMSTVYFDTGEAELAIKLIDSGMADLEQVVSKLRASYPADLTFTIPRHLENQYRHLISMKMQKVEDNDMIEVLQKTLDLGITLAGSQYNKIIHQLLKDHPSREDLNLAFRVSEEKLISGNRVDLYIQRTLRRWYRTVIYILSASIPTDELLTRFEILNRYYGIENISDLKSEFGEDVEKVSSELDFELKKKSQEILHGRWRLRNVIQNIPVVFLPARQIESENKLSYNNANSLWSAAYHRTQADIHSEWKTKYPRTIDFLNKNRVNRTSYSHFQRKIDQLSPPQRDEGVPDKRYRWTKALRQLKV